jgi:subtilisin family serine protease
MGLGVVYSGNRGARRALPGEVGRGKTLRSTASVGRLFCTTALAALALASAAAAGPPPGDMPNSPATPDSRSGEQWNLEQIRAFDAQAITGGSPLVRVALIDSGIDSTHPEFAGRIDTVNSASCLTGEPVTDPTGALWRDNIGHGTAVAGIVAAGDNNVGIVGVAPLVQLLIVKVTDAGLPITPQAAACAFDYVATQNVDVANASFAVDRGATGASDPLDYFCRSDKADKQPIELVDEAVKTALRSGATVVASAGNNGTDMAHPATGDECLRMPVGLPGVIGVSGDGREGLLTSATPPGPSNFGLGVIDVVAPGGDPAQGGVPGPSGPGGVILSTLPMGMYRYVAGTSFAAAHVSGVAALIVSRFGDLDSPQNGKLRPGFVRARLLETAEPKPCPPDPRCEGGESYNGFFGHGEVDALDALLR